MLYLNFSTIRYIVKVIAKEYQKKDKCNILLFYDGELFIY